MDTGGQEWTGVWSLFGHFLVIFVGEGFAVGFVGLCLVPLIMLKTALFCIFSNEINFRLLIQLGKGHRIGIVSDAHPILCAKLIVLLGHYLCSG